MSRFPHPPEDLLIGRRDLDDVPGYEPLSDVAWHAEAKKWTLHFRLRVPVPEEEVRDGSVPEATNWYALIAPEYPAGTIKVYPAAAGGLYLTYPHQAANQPPRPGEPWRQGDLCVATPARGFGRFALDDEPHNATMRLWWHVARTRSWVEAARRGELLRAGEPFELPVYTSAIQPLVVFDRMVTSLAAWEDVSERFGYATVAAPQSNSRLRVILEFSSPAPGGLQIIRAQWGALFASANGVGVQRAAWVRCTDVPALLPWRAPETWGELTMALGNQGLDLMGILRQLAPALRDNAVHLLLIGAPIPIRVGEPPALMHWQALHLPVLFAPSRPRHGFRPGEEGAWLRDQAGGFSGTRSLSWVPTRNWAPEEISTRGRAAPPLRDAGVVLIGAGALGSIIAEILVREGVTSLTIVDGETLDGGNLVRHTLTIADVAASKATGLAERLNLVNPYAQVVGIHAEFPGAATGQDALAEADIVIDSTGSDALLQQLGLHEWRGEKLFVSTSVGFFARRLFFFAARGPQFPLAEMAAAIDPWLLYEREEIGDAEMPWEGTGCWHPVFPARASDFAMFAGVLVRQLELAVELPHGEHTFHVTERVEDGSGAIQLLRASIPDTEFNG